MLEATVGYTGGHTDNPTYKKVCTNTTGHVEAVEVVFDPSIVSYEELLEIFWKMHDPTTPDRQGFNVGSQYRSAVFTTTPEQQEIALRKKEELQKSGKFKRPIVTEIIPASEFWPAEEYHQQYYKKHGYFV